MRSHLPKVLHRIAGKPMLQHAVDTAVELGVNQVVAVVGHGAQQVRSQIHRVDSWVEQTEQNGTGHAVQCALADRALDSADFCVVMYGDMPLISQDTLVRLMQAAEMESLALLACDMSDATGYGRVRTTENRVSSVVEQSDASSAELSIRLANTGFVAAETRLLRTLISSLSTDNAQGELYLTDIFANAHAQQTPAALVLTDNETEATGVNDRRQQVQLERRYQRQIVERLMEQGVSFADPQRVDIRGELRCGRDVFIDVDVVLEGNVELGDGVEIGPFCRIADSRIAAGSRVDSHCAIDGVSLAAACSVGPFARLRPGTEMAEGAKVGNFVETKQAKIGASSKINHLSYVGDAVLGERVNVGAGTITCNYDGANKHRTTLEDDVFIGSNSQLVAPVTVGRGSTVGAGTTVTRDVEEGVLEVEHRDNKTVRGWVRPQK